MDDLQPGQIAIAMALDKIDAWQVSEADWFRYLNLGFKSCVGTGSDYYFTYGLVRNMTREYSRMEKLSWENMVEAYQNHATFLTSGPLVVFRIDGKQIGDDVVLSGGAEEDLSLSISAWAVSGLASAELLKNGQVERTFRYADGPRQAHEELTLKVAQTCWFIVRVRGANNTCAITSPIYVQFGEARLEATKQDVGHFLKYIEQYRAYLAKNPPGHNRERELADADKAESVYRSLLVKPRTWLDDRPVVGTAKE